MSYKYGPQTNIEFLAQKLLWRWVPKWHGAFCDPVSGVFHERLNRNFKVMDMPYLRLLTQCRQMAMYAHAAKARGDLKFLPDLRMSFDALVALYHVEETGGWRFSVDRAGKPLDGTYDLYAHAFVLFALCNYAQATGDERARGMALSTLSFIDRHFRAGAGFHESLDERLSPRPAMRRHESHMHLLEACLFCAKVWDNPAFESKADEIVHLFFTYFYDADKNALSEYFTDDLNPMPKDGHIVQEPGHYGEWIWLLKKHAVHKGDPKRYDDVCAKMLSWANAAGWDCEFGGIYDELNAQGAVIADTKRLWPFAEILKANVLMLDSGMDRDEIKGAIARMVKVFADKYMDERGFWTEWLRRDLSPATDYMPGTTPYHVYFGIMEAREILRARGNSVSMIAAPIRWSYAVRRKMSDAVKKVRRGLKF